MNRERHDRNYGLHSWSGIVLGLFVYVVCFTGCLAMFHHEIVTWEDPAKRLPMSDTRVEMNDTFQSWLMDNPDGSEIQFSRFVYPDEHEPYFSGGKTVRYADKTQDFIQQRWNMETGDALPERGAGLSEWTLDFHRDLMWPQGLGGRTIGRSLVGVAGVILMLSILTGIIAHTKIVQEFFTLRYFRSVRLKWQDTHKVVGLWGLPFFTMMAFTGAVLGVVAILAPLVALLTFKGNQDALINEVLGTPTQPTGLQAQMLSVDELANLRKADNGELPAYIVFNNYGDETALFDVYYKPDTELLFVEGVQINGVTGDVIKDSKVSNLSPGNRAVAALTPLHYGTFGGIALKFLYSILGLALAIITALGLMMWIERRLYGNEGNKNQTFYKRLSHFTTGATVGLPVAAISIFYLDKLYMGAETARLFWTGTTYFTVWGLGILYAYIRRNNYRTTRELILITGLLCVGITLLNPLTTGGGLFDIFGNNHKAHGFVDLTFLVIGSLTAIIAMQLPKERIETVKKTKVRMVEAVAE